MRLTACFLTAATLATSLFALPAFAADHPRLIIGKEDIATLRGRVKTEPYASMVKAIQLEIADSAVRAREEETKAKAEGKTYDPNQALMYNFDPRNFGTLYLLTGDTKYADEAAKLCLAQVEDKSFWNNPGSKGLTRAAAALTVALAYDACYDAWPESTRTTISKKLREASDNLIKSMGAGANNRTANNWQGVRYSAAGCAALASDEPECEGFAKDSYNRLKRHLSENLSDNGWNPEGIGYTAYPWTFTGPFGIAAARNGIGDIRKDVKKTTLTLWSAMAGSVAIPRGKDAGGAPGQDGSRGLGLHGDLSDDNTAYSPDGTAGLAFFYSPDSYKPGVKWVYDHFLGTEGDKSFDTHWGGGLYSVLLYPADTVAKNPAEVIDLTYTDKGHGVAIFRNAFKDENDIVLLVNAHSRQPAGAHGGPDTNTFRLLGLGSFWATGSGRGGEIGGQTNMFPSDPSSFRLGKGEGGELGKLLAVDFSKDGGGCARLTGSSMKVADHTRTIAVDFSGKSGAPAVIVNAETSKDGKFWRLNVPEFNTIKTEANTFTITSPTGATLVGTVIEPAAAKLRTGTVRRDNPKDDHSVGISYRGKKYVNNNWVDCECSGNVLVVLTLQKGPAPKVAGKASATDGTITVGNQSFTISADAIKPAK